MSETDRAADKRYAVAAHFLKLLRSALPDRSDTLVDYVRIYDTIIKSVRPYREASPFPHVVIDDFLPEASYQALCAALPDHEDSDLPWWDLTTRLEGGLTAQQNKLNLQNVLFMPAPVRQLIFELNAGPFLMLMQHLTRIRGLLPDPSLWGGGIHVIKRDGLLRVHTDFLTHPHFGLERRINLLLYLNPDWRDEYGGHLELWDRDMTRCEQRILPKGNRCVIFNTTDVSYHGHPHPLACPPDRARKSIALYYYTPKELPPEHVQWEETTWRLLPEEREQYPDVPDFPRKA